MREADLKESPPSETTGSDRRKLSPEHYWERNRECRAGKILLNSKGAKKHRVVPASEPWIGAYSIWLDIMARPTLQVYDPAVVETCKLKPFQSV